MSRVAIGREALNDMEWVSSDTPSEFCPRCWFRKTQGHDPNGCDIKRAIDGPDLPSLPWVFETIENIIKNVKTITPEEKMTEILATIYEASVRGYW